MRMDAQQILDMLLNSGQQLVDKGKAVAEEKLNLPEDPVERQKMLDAAGKGAIAAGAAAVLLGTGVGRKLTGAGLKLGSLAALGTVAYNAYQQWQSQQPGATADAGQPVSELAGPDSLARSKVLLTAMIAAAQADGVVDDNEKHLMTEQLTKLNLGDSLSTLTDELNKTLDAKSVATNADSPSTANEIYLITRAILNLDNEQEKQYLAQLVQELGLAPDLVAQLETQLKA